jgi:hypothetical protein
MKRFKLAFTAALAISSLALINSANATSSSNLPPIETQGSIRYVTGGIGADEATAMRHVESRYPLSLEFAEHAKPRDEFLADVGVTIKNQTGGTTLKTTSDGPFLFANVPPGKYIVTAFDNGKKITRQVQVASQKPEHLVFVW